MKKKTATPNFSRLVKGIEKSNTKFAKATQAQRIVMVAKDVLALLALKRIKAIRGNYVLLPQVTDLNAPPEGSVCQLQDILKMPSLPACSVCAIGGAMLASTLRLNDVSISANSLESEYGSYRYLAYCPEGTAKNTEEQMSDRALDVFPDRLLREMENAFERGEYGYKRFRSSTSCLRAIYQNLVDNKGKKFTYYQDKKKVVFQIA